MFEHKCFISIIILLLVCEKNSAYYSWPRPRTGTPCVWDGVQGTCENFWTCFTNAIDKFDSKYPPVCLRKNGELISCCTSCDLVANISSIAVLVNHAKIVEKSGKKSADKCLDYMMQYDYSCHKVTKKIEKDYKEDLKCYSHRVKRNYRTKAVHGVDARRDEYPHMALLGYGENLKSADWMCGGSIISDRFILTAAHCIFSRIGEVRYVAVGILKRSDPREMWQIYNVASFIRHPGYKAPSKYHDIALIRTDRRILMGPSVLPACLSQGHEEMSSANATGWGAKQNKGQPADVLQKVTVQEYNESQCFEQYGPHRHMTSGYNHTTQMCYGDREIGKDTCDGDSGGPLQLDSCPHVVIGVTSSGHPCGVANSPGLYTRVGHYLKWIEDIVWP